jgi:hypothetical protein
MTTIITGNFLQQDEAQRAMSELAGAGFASGQTTTFFVNPPGQHDLYALGGDEDESAGTEGAPAGSAAGATVGGAVGAAVGLTAVPALGPGAAVAAAGAGAYVGSLVGALGNTGDRNNSEPYTAVEKAPHDESHRKSGMLVAASAPASAQQDSAIGILRAHGATDIERSDGVIVAGDWTDFNPLTPLNLVAG